MKELPRHLKYAFLGPEKVKLVIISTALTVLKEQKLMEILRKYKEAIAWSIEDLKGISPSIFMHKILLWENAKDLYRTSKKTESCNERSCQKRSTEMVECRLYI